MIVLSNHIVDVQGKKTFPGFLEIQDGRILKVGPLAEIPFGSEVTDYSDYLLIPSFIDAHVHLFLSVLVDSGMITQIHGYSEEEVADQVMDIPTIQEWKIGIGWYSSEFGQNVQPSKRSLDLRFPDMPVALLSGDAHTLWLNSEAMRRLGITKDSVVTYASGEAMMENGECSGVFLEAVAVHYIAALLEPFHSTFKEHFVPYQKKLNAMGMTAVGDVALTGEAKDDLIYPELYAQTLPNATVRVQFFPAMREKTRTIEQLAERYQDDCLAFAGVKQFFDGVTSTHTAYLKEPYQMPYWENDRGSTLLPVDTMRTLILEAAKREWPMRIHTIGDQAIQYTLQFFQESKRIHPLPKGKYHALEHLEVMDWEDLPLTSNEELIISVQPSHLMVGWETLEAEVGPERAKQMFPFQSFQEAGATLAFGTDSPVVVGVSPIESMYYATARKDLAGIPREGLMPEQKMTAMDALVAHTLGAAKAIGRTDIGSLEAGKYADFCVVDRALLSTNPDELLHAKVHATYLAGKKVFEVR